MSEYIDPAIISQYANSPTINRLISDFSGYINPQSNFDEFVSFVWDIRTAQSWGLDVLGKIVGISRQVLVPDIQDCFGFKEAGGQPFGQAPFYAGAITRTHELPDEQYRTLILTKALLNISNFTAPAINRVLQFLFAGRGRCFCADNGGMEMVLVFDFALEPFELSILTQSAAMPKPAAVNLHVLLAQDWDDCFGFKEAGGQPFGQGVFFDRAANLIPSVNLSQNKQHLLFDGHFGFLEAQEETFNHGQFFTAT